MLVVMSTWDDREDVENFIPDLWYPGKDLG